MKGQECRTAAQVRKDKDMKAFEKASGSFGDGRRLMVA